MERNKLGYITTDFVVRQADKEIYQPRLVVEKAVQKLLCFLAISSRYVPSGNSITSAKNTRNKIIYFDKSS